MGYQVLSIYNYNIIILIIKFNKSVLSLIHNSGLKYYKNNIF